MKTEMKIKTPYLIQRLKRPFKQTDDEKGKLMQSLQSAFSFGGGLKNGGLTDEAMKLLRDIWRYDYMGSSEFEWGAVPKSLQQVAELRKHNKLVKFEMSVTSQVRDFSSGKYLTGTKTVYVVCNGDFKNEIQEYIIQLAGNKRSFNTKESVNLDDNICGVKYCVDTVGWHDIDNHYLFFTDKEMFDNFCKLFGL